MSDRWQVFQFVLHASHTGLQVRDYCVASYIYNKKYRTRYYQA